MEERFERIFENEIQELRENVGLEEDEFNQIVKVVAILPEICEGVKIEDNDLIEILERAVESYDSIDFDKLEETGIEDHPLSVNEAVANAVQNHFYGEDVSISFPKY